MKYLILSILASCYAPSAQYRNVVAAQAPANQDCKAKKESNFTVLKCKDSILIIMDDELVR